MLKESYERYLFLCVVVLAGLSLFALAFAGRVVIHDSFVNFTFQYFCLNNVASSGEFPHWIPYLTHGVSSYYAFAVQGMNELFLNAVCALGTVGPFKNFLPLYYLSIFFDQLMLLVGIWLLSRRYYASPVTALFVAMTVLCSTIWTAQVLFNFHFYYAMPLMLEFGHRFLDSGRWRYLFFAVHLFFIQSLDKVAYFMPMVSFMVVAYFICLTFFDRSGVIKGCRAAFSNVYGMVGFVLGAALIGYVFYLILSSARQEPLTHFLLDRQSNGQVPLQTYLTYALDAPLGKWLELFLGFSVARDYTLYIGVLPLVSLIWLPWNRFTKTLTAMIGVLLLVSAGTFLASFLYYAWPLMDYYRHLGYIVPVIRVLLCFLAGFGFEVFLVEGKFLKEKAGLRTKITFILLAAISVGLFWVLVNPGVVENLFEKMGLRHFPGIDTPAGRQTLGLINEQVFKVLFLGAVLALFRLKSFRPLGLFVILILGFHALDVGLYAKREILKRTIALNPQQSELLNFQNVPYQPQRGVGTEFVSLRSRLIPDDLLRRSSLNWTMDAFLFRDSPDHDFPAEYWMTPLDHLIKLFESEKPKDNNVLSERKKFIFPVHAGIRKMAGVAQEKIQFFSNAYRVDDQARLGRYLSDAEYKGNVLFVSSQNLKNTDDRHADLTANERLSIQYNVRRFDPNHVWLDVDVPNGGPVWLLYSDVWHPKWQAMANGQPLKVWQAAMAYKAVQLNPGKQRIEFNFYSPLWVWLLRFVGLSSLCWVFYITWQASCFLIGRRSARS